MMTSLKPSRRQFLARLGFSAAPLIALAPRTFSAEALSPAKIPRCRIIPLPDFQTSFELAGREKLRWHFGPQYPRPFFFPFIGPSGSFLTRMGHPGAPNHDHHRSIWFAHEKVDGFDFWTEGSKAHISQKQWLCYDDADDHCTMAVRLGWFGGEPPREIMEQTLIAISRPSQDGEHSLELQSTFHPIAGPVHLGKTNFGFLAVRVAKSISEFFGGGHLTDSTGRQTESAIFGQPAQWVDYSGPVADGVVEGITYFDHPSNAGSPTLWHLREDGWMGASFCMKEERVIAPDKPLKLRYLLYAHRGPVNARRAAQVLSDFTKYPAYDVLPSKAKHRQFELRPGQDS